MTLEIGLVFAILGISMLLFITGWIRADIVAVLVLVSLAATGLLEVEEVLKGFSSEAVIAIAGLLILSAGLVRSGVVRWIAERLNVIAGGSRKRLTVMSSLVPGFLSGFVSDIATVSLFIPVVLRLARKNDMHRSKLLLPIAMGALAGGNLTIIGASHNLVVNDLLQSSGQPALGFFEIAPVGIALIISFAVYTLVLGQRLLPGDNGKSAVESREDRSGLMRTYHLEDRLWEVLLLDDSSWVGKTLQEIALGGGHGLTVLSVVRHDEPQLHNRLDFVLQKQDVLLVSGRRTRVDKMIQEYPGLKVLGHPSQPEKFPSSSGELIEVVVPPRSAMVGKTMTDLNFRTETCLTGVAIWRADTPIRTDVGTIPLQEGDALLLYGAGDQTRSYDPRPGFLWLHKPRPEEAPLRLRHLGKWAALIMAGVVALAGFGLLPIAIAALGGAALMVLIGILPLRQLYEHVEWRTVVLVGGMYPLGLAMEKSGAAGLVSSLIADTLGTLGPHITMMGITLIALLLTQALHGAAVAVIMTPVALDTAGLLGIEPQAFAVAVIVGAAATYLLPEGHPAPLMVQSPGAYETWDYLKFGAGLVVITLAIVAALIPLMWPF
ncbi:SLC13 family permease [Desulfomicrobium baculatum]|uniref:Citrate transporter n=1 Tax=Desulfomicrobium baculatum (strain DSM 4028 / VKM B-1378 / X) TaxID=525897 RepID=C7LRD5_DESBD|nr:SLC13 family permease [Desulfomicrobium baculatum]ACU89281.1 Citrate transporter [Desulfomicrobium baculatum DSM 4028]